MSLSAARNRIDQIPVVAMLHRSATQAEHAGVGLSRTQFKQGVFESLLAGDYEDAVMHHWPSIVKWYKLSPPPDAEAVKAALQKLDFVRL